MVKVEYVWIGWWFGLSFQNPLEILHIAGVEFGYRTSVEPIGGVECNVVLREEVVDNFPA